jgi:hypothetical protein
MILSAGSLLLTCFTFVFFLNYLKRRTGRDRILAELLGDLREGAAEIEREINAVTDRDVTLVEDRVKTLRALLEDTDRRIAVYVRELERRQDQEETFAVLDKETPVIAARNAVKSPGTYSELGNRRPVPAPVTPAEGSPPVTPAEGSPPGTPAEGSPPERVVSCP